MCSNLAKTRYKTLYGLYWLCYECAKIRGHMLIDVKAPVEYHTDTWTDKKCECEHISHEKEIK